MKSMLAFIEKPGAIFIFCLIYALHMVEEFNFGFVEWANTYFGKFDSTQNVLGNATFFLCLSLACYLYYRNPVKNLWLGMSAAMWVLANSFLHISCTILGGEYSPGVITAVLLYVPAGIIFLFSWARRGLLNWKNVTMSFSVGAMLFMLAPTFVRATMLHSRLAELFRIVS